MKRKPILLLLSMASLFGPIADARGQAVPEPAELARRAEAIKPTAAELKWRKIPWLTDLTAGQRVARAEKRPLLLWVTGDDPLERC